MNAHILTLAILTILLSASLLSARGSALDTALLEAINGRPLPAPIEILVRLISHLGLLPTNVLIWAIVWYAADRPAGLVGGSGLVVAWGLCRLGKAATGRLRPYQVIPAARLVGLEPSGSSFPSSHAAMSVYTAVTLSQLMGWSGAQTFVAYFLAVVVCYARIYLGAHYPRDVLAGAVIGLAAALGTVAARHRFGPTS